MEGKLSAKFEFRGSFKSSINDYDDEVLDLEADTSTVQLSNQQARLSNNAGTKDFDRLLFGNVNADATIKGLKK